MSNTRAPKSPTLADIAAVTKPVEKIVRLCVAGDLFGEWEQLDQQLEEARAEVRERLRSAKLNDRSDPDDDPEVQRLAKAVDEIQTKMEKDTYEFRFRKLPGSEWDDLISANEPRRGNRADENAGINLSAFPKAAVRASCVSPEGISDGDVFDEFWAKLNAGQRTLLYVDGARSANQAGASIPKSGNASAVINGSRRKSDSASG